MQENNNINSIADSIVSAQEKYLGLLTSTSNRQSILLTDIVTNNKITSITQVRTLEEIQSTAENSNDIFGGAVAKNVADSLGVMAKNIFDGSFKTIKADYLLLQELKHAVDAIKNPEEKRLLASQLIKLEDIQKSNNANGGIFRSGLEGLKTNIGSLGVGMLGVGAALLSDSGLLGIGLAFTADAVKTARDKKLERKKDAANSLRESLLVDSQLLAAKETELAVSTLEETNQTNMLSIDRSIQNSNGMPTLEETKEDNRRGDLILTELENITQANIGNKPIQKEDDSSFFGKLFSGISGIGLGATIASAGAAITSIVSMIGSILGALTTIILPIVAIGNGIFTAFKDIMALPEGSDITMMILTGLNGLGEGILKVIGGIGAFIIDGIFGTDIAGFVDEQGGWMKTISNAVYGAFNAIGKWVSAGITFMIDSFIQGVDKIYDVILGIPASIIDWLFGTDITGFVDEQGGWMKTISGIFNVISDAFDSVLDWVEKKIRSIPFIGDSLANAAGFKLQAKDMSPRQLDDAIIEKAVELKAREPGLMSFVLEGIGLQNTADEDLIQLQNLEAVKMSRFNIESFNARKEGRELTNNTSNITTSNVASSVINANKNTTIQMKKAPINNDVSLMALNFSESPAF